MYRTIALWSPLLIPLALLGSCDKDDAADEVHVLAVLPFTGPFAVQGPNHENAIRMALEELVEAGAVDAMGRRFTVVPVNGGDGPEVVEGLVRDAVEQYGDSVLGIISSTGSAHAPSARVAIEHGIPHFETSDGANNEEFLDLTQWTDDERSYLMSSRALCSYEAIYTAEFIMARWPTATVALVRGDDEHDKVHTQLIRETLQERGFQGTLIEANDPSQAGEDHPARRQDFYVSYDALASGGIVDNLTAIKEAHNPDVIFWHLQGDANNLRFAQDSERAGFGGALVTCGMARNPRFIDPNENGLISQYLVGHDDQLPEDRFFFIMRSPEPGQRLDAFRADYEARFGDAPITFTPSTYDAALLWGLGVVGADAFTREAVLRSIEAVSQDGEEITRANLADGIGRISQGQPIDYEGVSGPMDMREDRTVPGSYYVERVIPDGGGFNYEELTDPPRVLK